MNKIHFPEAERKVPPPVPKPKEYKLVRKAELPGWNWGE